MQDAGISQAAPQTSGLKTSFRGPCSHARGTDACDNRLTAPVLTERRMCNGGPLCLLPQQL